jgi:hypothetical protein
MVGGGSSVAWRRGRAESTTIMKLKTVELGGKTYAEIADGKPVFVKDDGTEQTLDPASMLSRIGALNKENGEFRSERDSAMGKLKSFEGIADPAAALKALETIANIDQKKLVDAGKVDEAVALKIKPYDERISELTRSLAEKDKVIAEKDQRFSSVVLKGEFASSAFVKDLAYPADMIQALFGPSFKVEEGKSIGYQSDGRPVYSKAVERAGEIATFDEALKDFIDSRPDKDTFYKAPNSNGSGAKPGAQKANGARTMRRSEFDAVDIAMRPKIIQSGVQIVDG